MDKAFQPGTVSHGTLITEDLVVTFYEALRYHRPAEAFEIINDGDPSGVNAAAHGLAVQATNADIRLTADESESVHEYLTVLFDTLDRLAPDDHTFCAHPGDGSDFGFWPVDMFD